MATDFPSFHDGLLTGVLLDDATATVFLREASGEQYVLALEGVEALHIEDLRQGNIVFAMEVVTGRVPDADTALARLFTAPHPSAELQYHEAHARLVQRHIDRMKTGETTLVMIVPSYGADLLAICQKATCCPK